MASKSSKRRVANAKTKTKTILKRANRRKANENLRNGKFPDAK